MYSTFAFSCVITSTFGHGGHDRIRTAGSLLVTHKVHCEQETNNRAVGSRQNNPSLARTIPTPQGGNRKGMLQAWSSPYPKSTQIRGLAPTKLTRPLTATTLISRRTAMHSIRAKMARHSRGGRVKIFRYSKLSELSLE